MDKSVHCAFNMATEHMIEEERVHIDIAVVGKGPQCKPRSDPRSFRLISRTSTQKVSAMIIIERERTYKRYLRENAVIKVDGQRIQRENGRARKRET